MAGTSTWRNAINPRAFLGSPPQARCLCPEWMCWMPWLADGEDVRSTAVQGKEDRKYGSGHPAGPGRKRF